MTSCVVFKQVILPSYLYIVKKNTLTDFTFYVIKQRVLLTMLLDTGFTNNVIKHGLVLKKKREKKKGKLRTKSLLS